MVKVRSIPYHVLKGHPIVPKDAEVADVAYIEEGDVSYIVFRTRGGTSTVFDSGCYRTIFREEGGVAGSILTSTQSIGSTIWESAHQLCLGYIEAVES